MSTAAPFTIGWQEWVALPELGLPAIKAKVDTGARSSALHAFMIEDAGGAADQPMVRFGIHPVPGRPEIEIVCTAPVVGRRAVTSSNGETEERLFIRTAIAMGARTWPIEIGLTNRESMTYRMLLGRQAILDDMVVDARSSFHQPRLGYRLYRHVPRNRASGAGLRIAVVDREPGNPSCRRLAAVAVERGHALDVLEIGRLALVLQDGGLVLTSSGAAVSGYDAVVARIGPGDGRLGPAVVRQLEQAGSVAVTGGDALDRRANPLAMLQALAAARIPHAFELDDGGALSRPAHGGTAYYRVLVVDGSALAALRREDGGDSNAGTGRLGEFASLATRTATALGLGLASVDIEQASGGARIVGVNARPALARFERLTGVRIAEAIVRLIERRVRYGARRG